MGIGGKHQPVLHSSIKTLTLEMEDPFNHLTKLSTISESQSEYLRLHNFELEDLALQSNSSASESTPVHPIIICSPPINSSMVEEASSLLQQEEEDEHFQTPEENLQKINGGESSGAVDLGRDTDLLFSDGNHLSQNAISTEVLRSEHGVLIGESSNGGLELRLRDFDLNVIPDDSVGEHRDEETENVDVFSGDVEMEVSPLVHCIQNSDTVMVELKRGECAEFPEKSQPEDVESDLVNEMSKGIGAIEVQDKFEINGSNDGTANLVSGVRKLPDWVTEFAQREERSGGRRGGSGNELNSDRESEEQRLTGAGSSSQVQASLARGGRGLGRAGRRGGRRNRLNSGREERSLAGSQGPEMRQEANDPSANVTGVTTDSSGENATQQYVKLSDLVEVDDNDILVAAIKAGMKFPRPRWWRPEGYGPSSSQPLISRLSDFSHQV